VICVSKFEGTDWDNIDQTINISAIKGEYSAWKTHWNQGDNWGIVGGKVGDKPKPKTVLESVLSHGDATYARDQASSTEGLGLLLESLTEIFDGDTIEEEHEIALEAAVDDMLELLKADGGRWNPRNIPFNTVTEFIEGDEGEQPTITRTEVRGHYRTKEYNKYVKWAQKNKKNYKGQLAVSKDEWWHKDKGTAQPPLWQAITGEGDTANGKNGILAIARRALKAVKKIKMGDGNQLAVFNNSNGPKQLAQIKSVQEKVIEVLQRPDIYPAGKARAPMKDRLNAAFSLESYAIRNKEEAALLSFGKGFDRISGIDKLRTIRLRFPASNIALNRTIKEVLTILGKDLKTYETPKVKDGIAKPGLVLKQKVEKRASSWEEMMQKKYSCLKPDCPYAQYSGGGAEVTTQQAKSCSKKASSGCPGNKLR
tara:strand:+ start:108 stop:1382 length:1275 start_codon:yes stop_codon:yes gene_type:complete